MSCREEMKADSDKERWKKVFLSSCFLRFLLFFLLRLFLDLAVCEIHLSLCFFFSVFLFWPLSLPFPSHSSVKHAVRFVPFAFPWHRTKVKYREKINQWGRTFKPTTHTRTFTPTCAHARTHAPFCFHLYEGGVELKRKDGRCSTSSENCNFCSPGSPGWQEIFHPRCHHHINKTSGAECSLFLSHTDIHT